MSFKVKKCDIPTVWCGNAKHPPSGKKRKDGMWYYKTGTRYECMKKGFGAGSATEKKSNLPLKSLQQIKYVGEKHEASFKKKGIDTKNDLMKECKGMTSDGIKKLLKKILKKKDGKLDKRAYNSVLLYLYHNGIGNLPSCKKIKPPK